MVLKFWKIYLFLGFFPVFTSLIMTKKIYGFQIWMPLMLGIFLAGGIFLGSNMYQPGNALANDDLEAGISSNGFGKVEEIIRYIEAKYVDELEQDELTEEVINEILRNLDPHSLYIPADKLLEVNEKLDGNFEGIGIELFKIEDTIVVMKPMEGGPSEKAGVMAGDKIISVNDSLISGVNRDMDGIIRMLKGEVGSLVKIAVLRGHDLVTFEIPRDNIPISSIDAAYLLAKDLAYIKISRFSANTFKEFIDALEQLLDSKKPFNLVIDLRGNPGGYLQQATNILSQIFEEPKKLLVYTEGSHVRRNDYETNGRAIYKIKDLAVLIDEGSASASEILAGAVQDYDRGIIIGRRSYGKGLVQEQYNLRDGSALRLTIARYYTPSGRSIQRPYDDFDDYDNDLVQRFDNGEIFEKKSPEKLDSAVYYTSKGRLVYGKGGISPDIFIPLDSSYLSEKVQRIQDFIPGFVFRLLEQKKIKPYSDINSFQKNFIVSDGIFEDLLIYTKEKGGYENSWSLTETQRGFLKNMVAARIAKHLFDDNGFYTILNSNDSVVLKAAEVLKKPEPISLLFK